MLKSPEGPKEERGFLENWPVLARFIHPDPIRGENPSPIQRMTNRRQADEISKQAKRWFLGGTAAFIIFEAVNTCRVLVTR